MDQEIENMIATCKRLSGRIDARDTIVFDRMKDKSSLSNKEHLDLRAIWDKTTDNGRDEGR